MVIKIQNRINFIFKPKSILNVHLRYILLNYSKNIYSFYDNGNKKI